MKQGPFEKIKTGFVTPLEPRNSGHVEAEKNMLMQAFCMISPIVIYMLYAAMITWLGRYIIEQIAGRSEAAARYIAENGVVLNSIIRMVALTVAVVAQIPAFLGEKIIVFPKKEWGCTTDPSVNALRMAKSMICGISCGLTMNIIMTFSGIVNYSAGYDKIADRQGSVPIICGILLYGFISPAAEEFIFRGLVYNRMRRNTGLYASIILSSLFFGVFHFNIVQGIYGMIMGLLMVWIYERYGSLMYPVAVHMSTNIVMYLITKSDVGAWIINTPAMIIITGVIGMVSIYMIGCEKIKS